MSNLIGDHLGYWLFHAQWWAREPVMTSRADQARGGLTIDIPTTRPIAAKRWMTSAYVGIDRAARRDGFEIERAEFYRRSPSFADTLASAAESLWRAGGGAPA